MFNLVISCMTTSNLPWFIDLIFQVPLEFFIASNFTFTTRHIHKWVTFSLWLSLFVLSEGISPLFPSSILDTYIPGSLIFQCHIFLPFHTVHVVIKGRILEWFAIPFSSGPGFVKGSILNSDWLHSLQPKMEKLYTVSKNKIWSWLWLRHELLIAKFRLKLKKVGKTIRQFMYDLNQSLIIMQWRRQTDWRDKIW